MKKCILIIETSNLTNEIEKSSFLLQKSIDNTKNCLAVIADYNGITPTIFNDYNLIDINEWHQQMFENIEEWETDKDFIEAVKNR